MNHRLRISVALASVALMTSCGGCGRTPPSGSRAPKADVARSEPDLLVTHDSVRPIPTGNGARAVIRDSSVSPAAFAVGAPTPKTEQQLAADALTRIGPPAVPMLVEALHGTDRQVRRQACAVLMRMGPDAKEAVSDLVSLLDDPDEELRRMAETALGRIGPEAGQAVPALMRKLLEGEPPATSGQQLGHSPR